MDVSFEYLDSENYAMANIVSPTEVVVISSFHIELGIGGDYVALPYSMWNLSVNYLTLVCKVTKKTQICVGVRRYATKF